MPAKPEKSEELLVASIVSRVDGDIRYITQGMAQLASRSIRNDLATIRERNERLGLPRFPSMVCAGFMLNKRIRPCPVFTDMFTRRSRSVLNRRSAQEGGVTARTSWTHRCSKPAYGIDWLWHFRIGFSHRR